MNKNYELIKKIIEDGKYKVLEDDGEHITIRYQLNVLHISPSQGDDNFVSVLLPNFADVTEENFAAIAELMLGEVRDVLKVRGIDLSWDQSVVDCLVRKGYSTVYGARNLRRLIQKDVEDLIAARMISEHGKKVTAIHLVSDGEHISIAEDS